MNGSAHLSLDPAYVKQPTFHPPAVLRQRGQAGIPPSSGTSLLDLSIGCYDDRYGTVALAE